MLKRIGYIILVAFVMTVFLYLTYMLLIDVDVIENHIFLQGFSIKMKAFAVIGYLIASVCFFVYLLLADQAHQLEISLPPGYLTKLESLKSTFEYSFAFSALILSVFIIWLGSMFNAINSMDLMNYYQQISGKTYMNNNYVYIVGLLHSLLLLIFYIPVHLKFNSLDIVKHLNTEGVGGNSGIKNNFVNFFGKLSPLFITASPLITSFVQDILTKIIGS